MFLLLRQVRNFKQVTHTANIFKPCRTAFHGNRFCSWWSPIR